jgi:Lon protease-like protein
LPDVVLYPRHAVTLSFQLPNERQLLERVLDSPSKLLVVCGRKERGSISIGSVGVTAELRGVKRGPDGAAYARALGCQRCRLERFETVLAMDTAIRVQRKELVFTWSVLDSGDPGPIPRMIRTGYAFWSEAEARRYDTRVVMEELLFMARKLVPRLLNQILGPESSKAAKLDPDTISYRWECIHP